MSKIDGSSRRRFLQVAAAGAMSATLRGEDNIGQTEPNARPSRIVDTHTHFFDPTRPQGVPFPSKTDAVLYKTTLPEQFKQLVAPLGIGGTIVVEASDWVEDNQWLLDLAAKEPFLMGVVGNLNPNQPEFANLLKRFSANPLYRGIRLGQSLLAKTQSTDATFAALKPLADAGLQIDLLGGYQILEYAEHISRNIPDLRIVIDHFIIDLPTSEAKQKQSLDTLKQLAERKNVYAKVSNVLRRKAGRAVVDVENYRTQLDQVWNTFGEDRVLYGSNWPVSNNVAPYADVLNLMCDYMKGKSKETSEKYFWRNSQAAYRWAERK